jgi:hypothetical protein
MIPSDHGRLGIVPTLAGVTIDRDYQSSPTLWPLP